MCPVVFALTKRQRSKRGGPHRQEVFPVYICTNILPSGVGVSYLWQGGAELALQRVPVVDDVLQMLLGQAQALLGFPQRVQQPVPLVQHVDHQLLEVGVGVRGAALGAALAQRRVLADGGHHLAHHLGSAGEEGERGG